MTTQNLIDQVAREFGYFSVRCLHHPECGYSHGCRDSYRTLLTSYLPSAKGSERRRVGDVIRHAMASYKRGLAEAAAHKAA